MLELARTYKGDERFRLDDRFKDSDSEEDEPQTTAGMCVGLSDLCVVLVCMRASGEALSCTLFLLFCSGCRLACNGCRVPQRH